MQFRVMMLAMLLGAGQLACGEPREEPEPEPEPETVGDIIAGEPRFSAYAALLGPEGLSDLENRDRVTVFAPDNSAIGAIPSACFTKWQVLEASDPGRPLTHLLRHHVALGSVALSREQVSDAAQRGEPLVMESFEEQSFQSPGDDQLVSGRSVVGSALAGSNGVIHPIAVDVLLPSELREDLEAGCQ